MNVSPTTEPLPQGRDVLHIDELAVRLGISKAAVRDAINRGEIKAGRLGRRILIPLTEVRRILAPAEVVA